jgi:hypothetical protein
MATFVDTESRLAEALRVLLGFAIADTPEWITDSALAARNRAYTEAAFVLDEYDEREPAVVTAMPSSVVRGVAPSGDVLALAS